MSQSGFADAIADLLTMQRSASVSEPAPVLADQDRQRCSRNGRQ